MTPRTGKPVEIQALWYNALAVMEDLSGRLGDSGLADFLRHFRAMAKRSFLARFWNPSAACLFDVVDDEFNDDAVRPNQIFAVSLAHSMLDAPRARAVVDVVRERLLAPVGLRSLAPGSKGCRGRYEGGVYERDSSYHQGTVWPWLIGPFLTAYVKTRDGSQEARWQALEWLSGFERHLREGCLGQISEIADSEAPHRPRGCAAQAWSVAELLRAAVEDVHRPLRLERRETRNNVALAGIPSA